MPDAAPPHLLNRPASDGRSLSASDATTISRAEAIAGGLHTYFTGRPCRRGHLATRYTLTCTCTACMTERMRLKRDAIRATAKEVRDACRQ